MLHSRPLRLALFACLAVLFLSACGGGGSRSVSAPTAPTAPPPPAPAPPPTPMMPDDFRTEEYNASWGLDAINAAEAYAEGYTGEGVIIGILDFNFNFSSSEVDYHPLSQDRDPQAVAIYEAQFGEPAESSPHGQAVARVMAGIKNDFESHGVAFDSEVLAVDFFSNVNESQFFQDDVLIHLSNPWTYLTDNGARVVNKSLGYDEDDIVTNPPDVDEKYGIETDAYVVAGGALLVSSAGNNSDPDPSLSNLDTIDILRANNLLDVGPGAFIIVGAIDENGVIAPFSDRAGIAKDYYLVAPGVNIFISSTAGFDSVSGTSFSAPHVTGAAAILFQRWPNLTARDVANILFQSATDLGDPGVDAVYGHGLLNLDAALQPMGASTVALESASVQPLVRDTALVLGAAFGDSPRLANSLSDVLMLDGYNRDFQIDLSRLVTPLSHRPRLSELAIQANRWHAARVDLNGTGTLAAAVMRDEREERIRALVGGAQSPTHMKDRHIIEFAGRLAGLNWSVGSGRQLADAMADGRGFIGNVGPVSLTGAFRPALEWQSGQYARADWLLAETTALSFGFAQSQGRSYDEFGIADFRDQTRNYALSMRLDHKAGLADFAIQAGALFENGTLLGSRAAGGLSLVERAQSGWITLNGKLRISSRLQLSASMTGALTDPQGSLNSVIGSLNRMVSTGFSVGLGARAVLGEHDRFTFTVHQPLRVERASAVIHKGISRRHETGEILYRDQRISLSPSGREIGVETAYEIPIGWWNIAANLAFRRNADHVAGRDEVALLLGFNRRY